MNVEDLEGCGALGCLVKPPEGVGTDGGCLCLPDQRGQRYVRQLELDAREQKLAIHALRNVLRRVTHSVDLPPALRDAAEQVMAEAEHIAGPAPTITIAGRRC